MGRRSGGFFSAVALWLVWLAGPVWAGLEICNDTDASHNIAVAYKQDGRWVSEGWWNLSPAACITPLPDDLKYRFYYYRATSPGWSFRDDQLAFCTKPGIFSIVGDYDCQRRGYGTDYFAKIDTGKEGLHFRQELSAHSSPALPSSEEAGGATSRLWGRPFVGAAVFHNCSPQFRDFDSFCTFVGPGRVFTVLEDGRTAKQVFAQLREMQAGTPILMEGDLAGLYENTLELVLRDVKPRSPNVEDEFLEALQGSWYSATDPRDVFTIAGSGRRNRYAGALTSMEYLSVMQYCGEYDGDGPYLYAWDSQGGTGLCYILRKVSETELVLSYLPRGTELRYLKVD
ncbi:DUF1036 domain-containing protein [Pseudophaeobacter sp.]|uniref:DUF1036 domain-containing protein n=1 Tax=Pseudophaeobacter sp. TaxID=1971739 RepID=UPI003298C73F